MLDLHPDPGDPPVEIVRDDEIVGIVPQDESHYLEQIIRARATRDALVAEGLFAVERQVPYEWLQHASTIDEWALYREVKGMSPLNEEFVRRLRALGADEADEVRKRERCTATLLRRLP